MCGIAGIVQYARRGEVRRDALERMLSTLVHRGPDDSGTFVDEGVAIGMRRLAVIDVAGGHQPIGNEDGSVQIVFNGEIYNHHALRARLEACGHTFRTRSDTETIVHLYEEHGTACVDHLDGMFAFALWDGRAPGAGKLLIARDRLGKKPLYYADVGGVLIFASEPKALLSHPAVGREPDLQAIHDFLSLGYVPGEQSIYTSIRKLPPGHVLELCIGEAPRIWPYWQWPRASAEARHDRAAVHATVKSLLYSAVEKRLEAEVPLGLFLSGGLDSGIVAAIASELRAGRLDTFSVGFEGPQTHNELPVAGVTARHIGARHHEFLCKPDIVSLVPEMVHASDEPFAIASSIPLLMLSRQARKEVTVVLTGDGGDEVLGGYVHYLYERWARVVRKLPRSGALWLRDAAAFLPGPVTSPTGALRKRVQHFLGNAHAPATERRLGWANWFDEEQKWGLYSDAIRDRALASGVEPTCRALHRLLPEDEVDAMAQANYLDARIGLPDEMLTKVDRMTMSASLEARCPLLDIELVEFCARLPMALKVPGHRNDSLKSILRGVATDLLPAEVLAGKKRGFNVPLDAWFRGHARSYLEHHLGREPISRAGFFDPDAVSRLLAEHQSGRANHSNRLFGLLTFQVWAEQST